MTDSAGATITRTFAAPRDLVFEAWVSPLQFARWFGGSGVEVPPDSVEMDVRPGGAWKATMILGGEMPDINWFGEYVEVDRPSKLVLTLTDRPGDARETVSVTFAEVADGTEMVFHQSGGNLDAAEYERVTAGWQTFFDAMNEFVTATTA
jgi:uncharacterized protein YndB with AHSA1/START domain